MPNEYEVIGVTHDDEKVCQDCMTKLEEKVAAGEAQVEDIQPILAEDAGGDICDRCGCPLLC